MSGSPVSARNPGPDVGGPARAPDPVRAPVPVNGRSPVDGEGLDKIEGELGLAAGRRADDGHAHQRGPRGTGIGARADTGAGTGVAVHADANGAGAHGGAPHISGRRGPTRLRACVHEDSAVSRWSLSWVSVTPELRSVR